MLSLQTLNEAVEELSSQLKIPYNEDMILQGRYKDSSIILQLFRENIVVS